MEMHELNDTLRRGTPDSPVFARVSLYDTPAEYRQSDEKPYAVVIAGVRDAVNIDGEISYMSDVVKIEETNASAWRRIPEVGSIVPLTDNTVDVALVDGGPYQQIYKDLQEAREKAPFQVSGRLYGEMPRYASYDKDHMWPQYETLDRTSMSWTCPDHVKNLDDAYKWVIENHPAYVQGVAIAQVGIPSPDFMLQPVPGCSYPEGYFETYENRMAWAAQEADRLGVKMGKETPEDVLKTTQQAMVEAGRENEMQVDEYRAEHPTPTSEPAVDERRLPEMPDTEEHKADKETPYDFS